MKKIMSFVWKTPKDFKKWGEGGSGKKSRACLCILYLEMCQHKCQQSYLLLKIFASPVVKQPTSVTLHMQERHFPHFQNDPILKFILDSEDCCSTFKFTENDQVVIHVFSKEDRSTSYLLVIIAKVNLYTGDGNPLALHIWLDS